LADDSNLNASPWFWQEPERILERRVVVPTSSKLTYRRRSNSSPTATAASLHASNVLVTPTRCIIGLGGSSLASGKPLRFVAEMSKNFVSTFLR
jgi:hypothetical protein